MLPWSGALNECRKRMDPTQQLRPSDAQYARTAELKRGATSRLDSETEIGRSASELSQARPAPQSVLVPSVRTARAAASCSGQAFIDHTLPTLVRRQLMVEIDNRGGGVQRRYRLGVPLQRLNAAIGVARGSFNRFLEEFPESA